MVVYSVVSSVGRRRRRRRLSNVCGGVSLFSHVLGCAMHTNMRWLVNPLVLWKGFKRKGICSIYIHIHLVIYQENIFSRQAKQPLCARSSRIYTVKVFQTIKTRLTPSCSAFTIHIQFSKHLNIYLMECVYKLKCARMNMKYKIYAK